MSNFSFGFFAFASKLFSWAKTRIIIGLDDCSNSFVRSLYSVFFITGTGVSGIAGHQDCILAVK
jgi:hypothetical protein